MSASHAEPPARGSISAAPLFYWNKVISPALLRRFAQVLLIWTFTTPTVVIAWTKISHGATERALFLIATVATAIVWGFLRLSTMMSSILVVAQEDETGPPNVKAVPGTYLYLGVKMLLALACIHLAGVNSPAGLKFWYFMPVSTYIILMLDRRSALIVLPITVLVPGVYEGITEGPYAGVLWMTAHSMMILYITGCMAAMLMAVRSRASMKQLAKELMAANEALEQQTLQTTRLAVAEERNRIAREIHDSVGHNLTVAGAQMEAAAALLPESPERARDALQKARAAGARGLAEIRQSVSALRDAELESLPLHDALQQLADTASLPGLEVTSQVLGEARPLTPLAEVTFLRCAQEGLTNACKHASASNVVITLDYSGRNTVTLSVEDNGSGFAKTTGQLSGLAGLKERARFLGGTLVTGNGNEGGGRCIMVLPA